MSLEVKANTGTVKPNDRNRLSPPPTVRVPTKLSRNAPCHCGSGKKYKRCCEPEEKKAMEASKIITGQNAPKLKNTFRDEARDPYAGIPEIELVRRDQFVLLDELRFRKEAIEADRKHFETAIARAKDMRNAILVMPKSPYKELVMKDFDVQIKAQEEKLTTMRVPIHMNLTLLALEELLTEIKTGGIERNTDGTPYEKGVAEEGAKATEDAEVENELTIPKDEPGEDVDKDNVPVLGEKAI